MEWVETTGKTLAEAKDAALDQLGVHEEDAEFDVLEEPQLGLFGRVRGEARVRARVRPAQARQKVDRRDRKRAERAEKTDKGETTRTVSDKPSAAQSRPAKSAAKAPRSAGSGSGAAAKSSPARESKNSAKSSEGENTVDPVQVGEEARRFVDELVAAFRLTGTTELISDGDDLEIRVHGQELGLLVGPRGTTLQAVQDLTRVASQRRLGDHDTRLRVDVGGYRERRRAALGTFATQMADEVKASGVARVLEPMSSADRKVIHDTLATIEEISTRSEGDDPYRRVVIAPANG
ncbi:MAG: Jag N-terminal domain-containing protein [Actinomycetia bacterium]|nr:Jag N-terminal domain-containing protein [Actinomycetes bacterium]